MLCYVMSVCCMSVLHDFNFLHRHIHIRCVHMLPYVTVHTLRTYVHMRADI